jgi:hypothetical protein
MFLALAFIGMIFTPAIVAALSGKKGFEPEIGDGALKFAPQAARRAPVRRVQCKRVAE